MPAVVAACSGRIQWYVWSFDSNRNVSQLKNKKREKEIKIFCSCISFPVYSLILFVYWIRVNSAGKNIFCKKHNEHFFHLQTFVFCVCQHRTYPIQYLSKSDNEQKIVNRKNNNPNIVQLTPQICEKYRLKAYKMHQRNFSLFLQFTDGRLTSTNYTRVLQVDPNGNDSMFCVHFDDCCEKFYIYLNYRDHITLFYIVKKNPNSVFYIFQMHNTTILQLTMVT